MLAVLLERRNTVVTAEAIAEAVWGEEPPSTWRTALQVHVSNLRKLLGPEAPLVTRSDGYALEVSGEELDADAFLAKVSEARRLAAQRRARAAATAYTEALALWRGEPFAGTDLVDQFAGRAVLTETWAAASEERAAALLESNEHAEAVAALTTAIAEHPFRERLRELLILALYRSGRQEEALAAYREAREALLDELGVDPGPALRSLEAAVLAQDPGLLPAGSMSRPSNVPAPANATFGREGDIAELTQLLIQGGNRLVTLVGPGGVGKTRLANEAALRLGPQFAQGSFFVSLAEVTDPERVAGAVARGLGIAETIAGIEADLERALKDRVLLVVLDNMEQVLASAPLLAKLLAAAPGLSLLVTSRAPLRLSVERLVPVGPLVWEGGGPAGDAPAVALFLDRAQAALPSPGNTGEPGTVVADICALLDGLPLAIELAAARLETFSLHELHGQLADVLALTSADADRPDRHRGLEAALRWSWDLLGADEQYVAMSLSAFAGAFGWLDAAAVAAGMGLSETAARSALAALVRMSLVVRGPDAGLSSEFRLLGTVRAFMARELRQSGREWAVRMAHMERMLVACGSDLSAPHSHSLDWYNWMATHYTDVMTAIETATLNDRAAFFRFVAGLSTYWAFRAYFEDGERWTSLAVSMAESSEEHVVALAGSASIAVLRNQREVAAARLTEALGHAHRSESPRLVAAVLSLLGITKVMATDLVAGRRCCEEALALFEDDPDPGWQTFTMGSLARINSIEGQAGEARKLLQASLTAAETAGFDDTRARIFTDLGEIARLEGDLDLARERYRESLAIARSVGARSWVAVSLMNLVFVERSAGNATAMRDVLVEAFALSREMQHTLHLSLCLAATAGYAGLIGDASLGARLLGAWRAYQADKGPLEFTEQMEIDRDEAALREALGAERFEGVAAEGARLTLDEGIALATSILDSRAEGRRQIPL